MATNKRKSGDVFSQSNKSPSVVVVTDSRSGVESSTARDLHEIYEYLFAQDPLLNSMQGIEEETNGSHEKLKNKSSEIKYGLERELQQELNACEHASRVLVNLEGQVEKMKQEQKRLVHEMDTLDKTQILLQRNISKYQEEASHEIVSIDQVEEEQKRLVPRLKTQVSLYASTTGIRWDFAHDEILSGQVVRPMLLSRHGHCLISPNLLKNLYYESP